MREDLDGPDPFELDDAAYLLGALSPAERARYEQHLGTCDACRRSVAEVAGLPGVLRHVSLDAVRAIDHDGDEIDDAASGPPPSVLAGALRRAEVEERRARRTRALRWASALTTAAAAAVVGVLAFAGPGPDDPAPAEPPPSARLDLEPLGDSGLTAAVNLRDVAWGTKIQLECAYPDGQGGEDVAYSLVVHDDDGDTEQVATWNAVPGRELTIDAATAVRGDDIALIEVRAPDGTPVLRTVG